MIAIDGLVVRYPRSPRAAVDGLTLSVAAGEVYGFIGPNGAGKTSTLKVLCGLLRAEAGRVVVAGVDVVKRPADVRRRVGYLPDDFGVHDDLTCSEYLEFFAAAQGIERARRASLVEGVLGLVDLQAKAHEHAGSLSRGMKQRLGLARVLVHEPDVLLLDEPASGLDPRARIEIREVLRELGRMGKTVVLSSHVLADIASACTSVGIIEQGKLVFHGPVQEAVRRGAEGVSVLVAVVEGADAARVALAMVTDVQVDDASRTDGMLRVRCAADSSADAGPLAAARIARALQAAGLTLTHLTVEKADLEHAFMTLTEGRVS